MARRRPPGELVIPPAAVGDERSIEMLRVWIAAGRLHISLNIGHWDARSGVEEDLAWGMMLADAIRHIANALQEAKGIEPAETIRRVFKMLETELDHPTTAHRGRFVGPGGERNDGPA